MDGWILALVHGLYIQPFEGSFRGHPFCVIFLCPLYFTFGKDKSDLDDIQN